MAELDRLIAYGVGVSVYDLSDQPFRDWYDDGITAAEAAELVTEAEGATP